MKTRSALRRITTRVACVTWVAKVTKVARVARPKNFLNKVIPGHQDCLGCQGCQHHRVASVIRFLGLYAVAR